MKAYFRYDEETQMWNVFTSVWRSSHIYRHEAELEVMRLNELIAG